MVDVWWRVVQETKVTTKYNRDKKLTWGKKAAKTSKTAGVQVGISIRNANFQLGESGKWEGVLRHMWVFCFIPRANWLNPPVSAYLSMYLDTQSLQLALLSQLYSPPEILPT